VTAHLTVEQRALARRLRSRGWGLRDIAKEIGCSRSGVDVMLRGQQRRAAKPVRWTPRAGRLSLFEREEIRFGLARGKSMSAIARGLGRAPSSVTREVKANGGVEHYRVWPAYLRAEHQTARTKVTKLSQHPLLCAKVVKGLESLWSPEEISARLRREFPGDPTMQVSPETIYQSLYVQGRGELRRELARCLRSGRTTRKPQGRAKHPGPVANMVMIADRPAEVADWAVPGHWEGDLILGKDNRSAVGTLVERSTRFVVASAERPRGTRRRGGNAQGDHYVAARARAIDHLGPRWRDGPTRRLHGQDRCAGLFLRSAFAMATWIEREYERSAAPIPAQEHRPVQVLSQRPSKDPAQPQRTTTQDARLYDADGETRRTRCAHRLNPPSEFIGTVDITFAE
jgi:IS30 family transposase